MMQTTFGIIKPDAVNSGLVGNIKTMIESIGLTIVEERRFTAKRSIIEQHYNKDDAWCAKVGTKVKQIFVANGRNPIAEVGTSNPTEIGRVVLGWVVDGMTSGDLIIMKIEGYNAVDMYRDLCGATYPDQAEDWTIRGSLSNDDNVTAVLAHRAIRNLVHSSETLEEAEQEIELWFGMEAAESSQSW